MRGLQVELFESKKRPGRWMWRLRAGNGEVLAHSQGYTRKWSAKGTAGMLGRALQCEVIEVNQ